MKDKLKNYFAGFNPAINIKKGALPSAMLQYVAMRLIFPTADPVLALIVGLAGFFGGSIVELLSYVRHRDANTGKD